ncbi:hypothetical protein BS333_08980 [Vibrio azureus]|uniref:Peptidase C31 domain-containing protein n=1 Tax=Vibrio azureus NBRC 104587 TaxID=1219077 RepID=U3ALE7_9VIBR|nr:hypothetical protein [Vibrio azureus]AUI86506.1 hypothetical protein BS333_08980 [Vibrio azureus]GAD74122.1 hypothetical protein VAZ01S_003_00110 [Vibrio azureus NBRC 104587]
MFTDNKKSLAFLIASILIMVISFVINVGLASDKEATFSVTTNYVSSTHDYVATEHVEAFLRDQNFESLTILKETGMEDMLKMHTYGYITTNYKGLYHATITSEEIHNVDLDLKETKGLLLFKKYISAKRKRAFMKSIQIVEELPGGYLLLISDKPIKKMTLGKFDWL